MGRVSKHKKIKAIDPFYKGPRKEQSREENLPPQSQSDDQPVPKSLLRLLNPQSRMKKIPQKRASSGETKREAISKTESQELVYSRREGESLKNYLDRIDTESRARLVVLSKKSKGTSERRKKYYEKRKRRLESKKGQRKPTEDILEFKDLKDTVEFGEVVSAPPRLSAKPRRKAPKTSVPSSEEGQEIVQNTAVVGLKRKQDLEEEREKLIQKYRMVKKTRTRLTESRHL